MAGNTLDLTFGGGGVSGPKAPRVVSSGLDTTISSTTINILMSEGIEETCSIVGQIDIEIDGTTGIIPLSVDVNPSNNRFMQIELPVGVSYGQDLKWIYNPAGSCVLQGLIAPNEPMIGGTYSVIVTGIPHVVNHGLNIVNHGVTITNP